MARERRGEGSEREREWERRWEIEVDKKLMEREVRERERGERGRQCEGEREGYR